MTDNPHSGDGAESNTGLPRAAVGTPSVRASGAFETIAKHVRDLSPRPKGFVEEAEDRLAVLADEFTTKLGVKAIDIAHERGGSAVDVLDVVAAHASVLVGGGPQSQAWELGVSGLTGGIGGATAVSLLLAPEPVPQVQYWWIGVGCMILISLVLLYRTRPRKKRNG